MKRQSHVHPDSSSVFGTVLELASQEIICLLEGELLLQWKEWVSEVQQSI